MAKVLAEVGPWTVTDEEGSDQRRYALRYNLEQRQGKAGDGPGVMAIQHMMSLDVLEQLEKVFHLAVQNANQQPGSPP